MSKRWAISVTREAYGDIADYFVGCYDSYDDAKKNAARYSLDHGQVGVTVFEATELVTATVPYECAAIPAITEAVQP